MTLLLCNAWAATHFCRLIISFSAQIFIILRGFCFLNSSLKKRTSPRTYCQRLRNSANVVLNTLSTHSSGTTAFWRLQHKTWVCFKILHSTIVLCTQYYYNSEYFFCYNDIWTCKQKSKHWRLGMMGIVIEMTCSLHTVWLQQWIFLPLQ